MSTDTLRRQLPDLGDALAAALVTLHADPTPASCELMADRLQSAARHVLDLRRRLMEESRSDGQCAR